MAARQLPIHERFRDLMGAFHEALDDRAQSSVLQRDHRDVHWRESQTHAQYARRRSGRRDATANHRSDAGGAQNAARGR
jgi:DNA-binding GntR family transcriptional regulator